MHIQLRQLEVGFYWEILRFKGSVQLVIVTKPKQVAPTVVHSLSLLKQDHYTYL